MRPLPRIGHHDAIQSTQNRGDVRAGIGNDCYGPTASILPAVVRSRLMRQVNLPAGIDENIQPPAPDEIRLESARASASKSHRGKMRRAQVSRQPAERHPKPSTAYFNGLAQIFRADVDDFRSFAHPTQSIGKRRSLRRDPNGMKHRHRTRGGSDRAHSLQLVLGTRRR